MRKTSISLAVMKILKKNHRRFPFLVIAPLRVCQLVWPKELKKWKEFSGLTMEILHGPKKGEALRRKADIYVINPEGLDWLFEELRGINGWPFEGLLVDESTKFKRASSLRSRLLRGYLPMFRRRYILTGSPSPNGLIDLFGQILVLDLGNALGRYVTHYRRDYFFPMEGRWIPEEGAEEKIYKRLRPLVVHMDAADYIKLPPLIGDITSDEPLITEVELPPAARKIYDDMEESLIAMVDKGVVTAANAAVAMMKCRQIANGGIYNDPERKSWSKIHDAKTDAVLELVESLQGQPLLVAIDFRHDEDRLLRALPPGTPSFSGGKSLKEAQRIEAAWNAGDLPVLLGNPQSVAWGLNLQEHGRAVAWHSQTWDWEQYMQFIRRVWRSGQKGRVFVHHIVARHTVDRPMLSAVKRKGKDEGALLHALREYAEEKLGRRVKAQKKKGAGAPFKGRAKR